MLKIKKCLNEWNATIEALGQGKQTILIRKYNTKNNLFFLYPTKSYINNEDYINSFKSKYYEFVRDNLIPKTEGDKKEVKYFATMEKIIEKSYNRVGTFNKNHIWTNEHVKSYLNHDKPYIWILRVYKLKEPIMAKRTRGLRFANLLNEINVEEAKPILSDNKFLKILSNIESK